MQLNVKVILRMLLFFGFLLPGADLAAQNLITIKGQVIDGKTKEPLPFVNVSFVGVSVGTTTDFDGNYSIETQWGSESLEASYVGYDSQVKPVTAERRQTINFVLGGTALELETVVVKAKKGKYRKKGNPAVALVRKVIANKKKNKLESYDYYEYDKYEKVELDINNLTDKFRNRKFFKKVDFIFDYVDTSEINNKPFLPVYLQETQGKVYYRKSPGSTKEFRDGYKVANLDNYLDDESVSTIMDKLYYDVDIYDNYIMLLTQQFVSPLSFFSPDFYRYYITDTLQFEGMQVIDLSFIPRNKNDLGFTGNMYIVNDPSYRVVKVNLGIIKDINLNFVKAIKIEQEFKPVDTTWVLAKDVITVDYNITKKGMGFYGKRTSMHSNHVFNQKREDFRYGGTSNLVVSEQAKKQDDSFWDEVRTEKLTPQEEGVYYMIDTLQTVPAFKRAANLVSFALTGYTTGLGAIDYGPINAFYSFNDVEGFRLRFGGRTNNSLSKKVQFEGYGAYGFKDEAFKYQSRLLYSFNNDFDEYPKHYIRLGAERETRFPGQELRFFSEDNFFLSFRRGVADRMLFHDTYSIEYFKETRNNLAFGLTLTNRKQRPLGGLNFKYFDNGEAANFSDIQTSEAHLRFKWAPNAQYWNGKRFRVSLFNKYPIFTFDFKVGLKDVLGGDYNYQFAGLNIFKRFYLSILGYGNLELEGGAYFGKELPYLLLHLPRANQTYAYQIYSFNMMNFLEFTSDRYVSLNYSHFFNGFFFNKIPLMKKLKLREVVTVKALYGQLRDINNPNLNPGLIQFEQDEDGVPTTYTLEDKPYVEVSVGVTNIFKFIRLDFIKRLTHLENPNVPQMFGVKGLGLRGRFKVEF